MKEWKNTGFVAFENNEEFEIWFKEFNDYKLDELNDDLYLGGNNGLKIGDVKKWIKYFGIENIYFEKSGFKNRILNEFRFNLKNAVCIGEIYFNNVYEISVKEGFLRIWFY